MLGLRTLQSLPESRVSILYFLHNFHPLHRLPPCIRNNLSPFLALLHPALPEVPPAQTHLLILLSHVPHLAQGPTLPTLLRFLIQLLPRDFDSLPRNWYLEIHYREY